MTEPQRTLIIDKRRVPEALNGELVAGIAKVSNENASRDIRLAVGSVVFVDAEPFKLPEVATVTVGIDGGSGLEFTVNALALGQTLGVAGVGASVTLTLLTDGLSVVGSQGDEAHLGAVGNTVTMGDGALVEFTDLAFRAGTEVQLLLSPNGLFVDFGEQLTLGEEVVTQRGLLVTYDEEQRRPTAEALGFEFDAVLSFSQEQTVELTRHPIETGARIVDHTIINPRKYRLDAVVTNTPLDAPASTGGVTPTTARRAEIFLANLQQLQRDARLVAVVHPQIVTREDARGDGSALLSAAQAGSFIITGLTSTATPETGGSVDMNIDIEEVVIVSTKLSTLPKGLFSTQSGAKDKGKTDPEPTTPAEAEMATTTSLDVFDTDPTG